MIVAVVVAGVVLAQPAAAQRAQGCGEGAVRVGDLGFDNLAGAMSFSHRAGQRPRMTFEREPRIVGVRENGPAAGRLRDGDVIVAVDGQLITTAEGGRRFSAIDPGDRVRLSVRRGGRVQEVTIVAGTRCMRAPTPPMPPRPPAAAAAPRPPTTPRAPSPPAARAPAPPVAPAAPTPPAAPAPPPPPEILPEGWFGFGIQCRNCGVHAPSGRPTTFRFGDAPTVVNVEPGTPAARAGMRRGDRLTHVDGVSLTTPEGWRRFGAIEPGQQVRWTYTRGGRAHQAVLRAIDRPDAGRARAAASAASTAAAAAAGQRLRYSGTVGGAQVEVRGAPVTVSTDPRTGETVIRSADLTVRIQPREP